MGLRDSVITVLQADSTLMALLSGGVHGGTEISRQNTPTAFDANAEIRPCALVRTATDVPTGPYVSSARTAIEIYFYQRAGYDTIEAAMLRTFSLLNRERVGVQVWEMQWGDDVNEQRDEALQCALAMSRYYAIRLK
jgi:hypothetical protein